MFDFVFFYCVGDMFLSSLSMGWFPLNMVYINARIYLDEDIAKLFSQMSDDRINLYELLPF